MDLFTSSTGAHELDKRLNCCYRTAVLMLLCYVEESEAQAVSNILSVRYLCLFCVSNRTKGLSAQQSAEARTEEGKGEE